MAFYSFQHKKLNKKLKIIYVINLSQKKTPILADQQRHGKI